MVYLGADLHRKLSHVAALDEGGTVVLERRFDHSPDAFRRVFGELAPEPFSVVFEATYGWGWFADLLADAGVKANSPGRVRNNAVDARTLTHPPGALVLSLCAARSRSPTTAPRGTTMSVKSNCMEGTLTVAWAPRPRRRPTPTLSGPADVPPGPVARSLPGTSEALPAQRGLDPLARRHPTQAVGRAVQAAPGRVVAVVPKVGVDVAAVHADRRRAGKAVGASDDGIRGVDRLYGRAGRQLGDHVVQQGSRRHMPRAAIEPQELDAGHQLIISQPARRLPGAASRTTPGTRLAARAMVPGPFRCDEPIAGERVLGSNALSLVGGGHPEPDRARHAGRRVAVVAVRVLREVLLVLVLCEVERDCLGDLGGDRAVAGLRQLALIEIA